MNDCKGFERAIALTVEPPNMRVLIRRYASLLKGNERAFNIVMARIDYLKIVESNELIISMLDNVLDFCEDIYTGLKEITEATPFIRESELDSFTMEKFMERKGEIKKRKSALRKTNVSIKINGVATLKDVERELLLMILEKHEGNKTLAARELGISCKGLYLKVKKYAAEDLLLIE